MSNTYFEFKQFRINQDQTGMKVTTDACLFGALIAEAMSDSEPKNILDIGTGTGLLSLMMAQCCPRSQITAVEIETNAFDQAVHNFKRTFWIDRLECRKTSIEDFGKYELMPPFDLIISNPPFFQQNQLGSDEAKNMALHNSTLSFEMLASSIQRLIALDGTAFIMYPPPEMNLFIQEMNQKGLFVQKEISVQDKVDTKVIRKMTSFACTETDSLTDTIVIKEEDGSYTPEFIDLLEPYYLHL